MKNTENNYLVSKNYNLLYDLIEMGLTLVCFVEYEIDSFYNGNRINDRGVAFTSIQSNICKVSALNIEYNCPASDKECFLKICKDLNLTFIEPTRIALSLDSCSSCENISDVECECIKNER